MMNVVDTSGWLEYFAESANASFFAPAIEDSEHLIVPVICIYEVFKKVLQSQGQATAEVQVADLVKGNVVDLDASQAMSAAMLSAELKLPMADSIILAVAREHQATLWTQDEHFKGLPGVQYIEKKKTE
jgi:toxin FitB